MGYLKPDDAVAQMNDLNRPDFAEFKGWTDRARQV